MESRAFAWAPATVSQNNQLRHPTQLEGRAERPIRQGTAVRMGVVMAKNSELEAFITESVRISMENGYHPTAFLEMRSRYGTVSAMDRLMRSGEIQSGFKRLEALGLLDWSVEAGVLRFPDEFSCEVREAAKWRLSQARGGTSGP